MAAKDLEKAEEQGLTEFFKLTTKINTSNMMCFNFEGKIQKYASPEEIIEEFYPQRLAYYQKRKASVSLEFKGGWKTRFFRLHRTSLRMSCKRNLNVCRTRHDLSR